MVFIYSSFFSLSSLKASRDPRIQGCEPAVESRLRGYEIGKIGRFPGSLGCFFAVATSGREFVHGRTNVHLSARNLQFNATASSRNASALSDEEGTTLTAQKKRLPLPRATLPSPCSSPCSLLILFPFANELLIDSFSYHRQNTVTANIATTHCAINGYNCILRSHKVKNIF